MIDNNIHSVNEYNSKDLHTKIWLITVISDCCIGTEDTNMMNSHLLERDPYVSIAAIKIYRKSIVAKKRDFTLENVLVDDKIY